MTENSLSQFLRRRDDDEAIGDAPAAPATDRPVLQLREPSLPQRDPQEIITAMEKTERSVSVTTAFMELYAALGDMPLRWANNNRTLTGRINCRPQWDRIEAALDKLREQLDEARDLELQQQP